MALVFLQGSAPKDIPDVIVKGDEVLEKIPNMKITSYYNGREGILVSR